MTDFYKALIVKSIRKSHSGVISNPGIPGEKSLNWKQISPQTLVSHRDRCAGNDSCLFCHHLIMPNKIR